jgi:glycerophosphoryl diester phosphodiesterase
MPGLEVPDLAEPDATGGRRILTLERLIEALLDAGRPVTLLIETKHPTRYGNLVELRLLDLLRRYGLDRPAPDASVRVAVMSFSVLALRRLRRMAPGVPAVLLLEFLPPGVLAGTRPPFGATVVGPGVRVLRARPSLVPRLRERGVPVYVWTVNEPADLDLVLELGVDGIITDRPSAVLRRLGR